MNYELSNCGVTSGDANESKISDFTLSTGPDYKYRFYGSFDNFSRKKGETSEKEEPFFGQNIREAKETLKKFFR